MGERYLYLDCSSGISGDMTVGALLDLGASREVLENALDSLGLDGYHLHFGRTKKCGIDAYDFEVHLEDGQEHGHEPDQEHHHEHSHTHPHTHRNLQDILVILDRLKAEDGVKELAARMFHIVAEAESKAHGLPIEEVHFHEVGAIDSIVDLVSVAVCIKNLGITHVVVSPLAEGRGYVRCQHGLIPVPVPATVQIAASYGLELESVDVQGEMVTPTGAAIAAALKTEKTLPKRYTIERVGLGAGAKDFDHPNLLRAMLLRAEIKAMNTDALSQEAAGTAVLSNRTQSAEADCQKPSTGGKNGSEETTEDGLWVLESNLDDCTGEALGFCMELLLEAGAKDVWYTPAYMKKNRPAYVLSVLCEKEKCEELSAIIFSGTTTIGIRRYPVERTILKRELRAVETRFGKATVKCCYSEEKEGELRCYPEYESVRAICRRTGLGFIDVFHAVMEDAGKSFRPLID